MKSYYKKSGTEIYQYKLVTDPPEAMYWSTYRLKKRDVKVITNVERDEKIQIRTEIYNDIIQNELS
jgi:DNA polymerase III alpha subunit (gram-positive type)